MHFNKIIRGHKRQTNTEKDLHEVLDAGFLCTVAFTHQGKPMMIPVSYGRKENSLYFHGSIKNFMLNEAIKNEQICVSVTHLDGLVLAKSLFNTTVNYRSAILFGRAELVEDTTEKLEAMKLFTEKIIPGRWDEVTLGTEHELESTLVVKFIIESASVKIRAEGPKDDDQIETLEWSGHIPLKQVALRPIIDPKRIDHPKVSKSVKNFIKSHS